MRAEDTGPGPGARAPRREFLPFHRPMIGEEEIAEVVATLRSGWLTMGPRTQQFEADFAAYVGVRHAIAVNSATAGLHLAYDALGIGAGDEIVTSPYTFTATAAAAIHLGARPVFVDIEPETLNLDVTKVEAALTPRTRAIVPVHMTGLPCDMGPLLALASSHGCALVEDAAHALPAAWQGRRIGGISDLTVFSFYAGKSITTGEGGMVTTDRGDLVDRLRTRRLHGISRDAWKRYAKEGSWRYDVEYPGYKANLTDIAAALGLHQLRKSDAFHAARARYAAMYTEGLADLPELVLPVVPPDREHAWHLYLIRVVPERLSIDRDRFVEELRARNIGSSVHFIPLHVHSWYRDRFGLEPEDFPVATSAGERALSLPLFPAMSEDDVADVIAAVRDIVVAHRRTPPLVHGPGHGHGHGHGRDAHQAPRGPRARHGREAAELTPVLVTGGAGYLGSHLVRRLLARGTPVRVLDRFLYGDQGLRTILGHPNLTVLSGDIRDRAALTSAMAGVDAVVALAAIVGDPACEVDRAETISINQDATGLLIDVCRRAGVRRLAFASSCSVYGAGGARVLDETSPLAPVSLYAETRVESERMLRAAGDDLSVVIFRFATLYGLSPRMRFDLVVNAFTAQAVAGRALHVHGGTQWRPNLHVADAAAAFVLAVDAPDAVARGRIFNVGDTDANHTIMDLARLVQGEVPGTEVRVTANGTDARDYRVSFERVREVLGFRAAFPLVMAVRRMAATLRAMGADPDDARCSNVRWLRREETTEPARPLAA